MAGAVIGGANSHGSMENRKAVTRRLIEFSIQARICCEQGPYDVAVEPIELAMSASRGRGRIGRAGE